MIEEILQPKLLLVDDEPAVLASLAAIFSKDAFFQVYRALSSKEAMETARSVKPDVIISDHSMADMDGIGLCRSIKSDRELSSAMFILFTDGPPETTTMEAGADDYAEKDLKPSVLISKAKACLRIKKLQEELKAQRKEIFAAKIQVERNFKELVSILVKILDVIVPGAGDRAFFAKEAADFVAERLGLDEKDRKIVSLGATLHEIGKVGLPDILVSTRINSCTAEDKEVFCHYPAIGSIIVSALSGFGQMAQDMQHQLENYDGTGLPDGLQGEEISLGARILRVIVFHEERAAAGITTDEIIEDILQSSNRLIDPLVASAFVEFLHIRSIPEEGKVKLTSQDLKDGMVTAADIYSARGVKLLPKGVRLQGQMISLLQQRDRVDPIIGGIYVYMKD